VLITELGEQGSWSHSDQPGQATEKAIQLIKAGITKAQLARASGGFMRHCQRQDGRQGRGNDMFRLVLLHQQA